MTQERMGQPGGYLDKARWPEFAQGLEGDWSAFLRTLPDSPAMPLRRSTRRFAARPAHPRGCWVWRFGQATVSTPSGGSVVVGRRLGCRYSARLGHFTCVHHMGFEALVHRAVWHTLGTWFVRPLSWRAWMLLQVRSFADDHGPSLSRPAATVKGVWHLFGPGGVEAFLEKVKKTC